MTPAGDPPSPPSTKTGVGSVRSPALFVLAGPPRLFDVAEVNAPDLWSIVSPKRTLKEAPAWTTAGGRLRWLHLSDLHFKETERWDRRATLQALLRKMEELKRQELSVPKLKDRSRDPHVARSEDSAAVGRWRRIHHGPASLDVFDVLMARVTAVDDPTSRAGTRPSPGRPSSSIWTVWVPISGTKTRPALAPGVPGLCLASNRPAPGLGRAIDEGPAAVRPGSPEEDCARMAGRRAGLSAQWQAGWPR